MYEKTVIDPEQRFITADTGSTMNDLQYVMICPMGAKVEQHPGVHSDRKPNPDRPGKIIGMNTKK